MTARVQAVDHGRTLNFAAGGVVEAPSGNDHAFNEPVNRCANCVQIVSKRAKPEAVMQENHPGPEARPGDLARRVFTGRTPMQRAMLVNSIACELGLSVEEVAPVYDQIYEQMARTAKVMDFLPALAVKNLRHHFHQMRDELRH